MRANAAQFPLPNVWLGVSVEDQATADARIPHLLETPAAVRFVSAEPLLGPTNVAPYLRAFIGGEYRGPRLDWIIVGGESGPGARPMHPGWARSLRDQCAAGLVPFFFKQWGAWSPPAWGDANVRALWVSPDGATVEGGAIECSRATCAKPLVMMERHGARAAGRLLDGREHNDFPATETPRAAE